jgi:DNA-directed RNA polymerase sigma subunit (sigma70/sigma32)
VIILRYGLGGEEPLPYREIARRLDLSHERVRTIEREALARLAPERRLSGLDEAV